MKMISRVLTVMAAALLALHAAPALGQVVGLQPTPMGMYQWNPGTNEWDKITTTHTANPAANTPQAFAMYAWNATLGQWVPCETGEACAGGSVIDWPTTGGLVVSNGTNSPVGIAPVNGDCAIGSGGVWTTGSCGTPLSLQHDGTPVTDQGTLNVWDSPASLSGGSLDAGYQAVKAKTDSIGGWAWETLAAATNFNGQCPLGIGALVGAFTDGSGVLKSALCLGNGPTSVIVPTGATQLILGVNDDKFVDNTGSFSVGLSVNGTAGSPATVLGTAMPWNTTTNPGYPYGINDGTAGTVALTGLSAGSTVTVTWLSGTVSIGAGQTAFNANGNPANITGSNNNGITGTYFPTKYMAYASAVGVVTSINSATGAFTFSGPGVSCTGATCTFSGGGSITWPGSGDVVLSNGTSSPDGVAEVDGDCLVGATGAWTAGSCAGSGGITGTIANTQVAYGTGANTVGGDATFTFNATTKVLQANAFATGTATQGYLDLIQNATAAPSQPAGSVRILAPTSGVTAYAETLPATAPTAPSVRVTPAGGGQDTWLQLNGTTGLFGGLIATPTLSGTGLTTAYHHSASFVGANVTTGIELYDTVSVASGDYLEGQVMTYPSTAFTATALFSVAQDVLNFQSFGIVIANTLTAQAMWVGPGVGIKSGSSGTWAWGGFGCTTPTACTLLSGFTQNLVYPVSPFIWERVKDDGTNVTYYVSDDGIIFTQLYTVPKSSSFLGSTGFNFLGVDIDTASTATNNPFGTVLLSWGITTP